MATDKKGRTFDPKAKKAAKEKTKESEKAGEHLSDELKKVGRLIFDFLGEGECGWK